ncbi:hypothetical protein [Cohnella fermenti]|uniref:Uncharacterized protein n=1 Tax=Cohnella fermenti TaxID=2565925 RepID=A0A4S4C8Q2_9BACL|nr:hypothetical protein [Cohnella fermenti]THF84412.1 hypothetical protein E6C55_00005 [Cohnella fermenti]
MIILNMYGKIEPVIISTKLGVGISNPPNDWVSGLQDDIMEEILIHEHNFKTWVRMGFRHLTFQKYDPTALVKKTNWNLTTSRNKSDLHVIAQNLIGINVLDFENSYLRLKNDTMDSPTCEVSYPQKFIDFCNMIQNAPSARNVLNHKIPFSTYSSDELNSKPRILCFLRAMLKHDFNLENYKKECIASC